ncbi:hypothetical protein CA850_24820 [Micromonospora echinospora]|nr:class I SAM-dependent methyltransferase [Micromonospora echinospora]OZV76999.1 hypothetical protein CA850_24820 [Micromonospora echinospora]
MAGARDRGMKGCASGNGPGAIAPDGSSVDLYARLPTWGEPELVHRALPPAASILELGCGAGRMTGPLVRLGHPVTAVDESPEMLARIPYTVTVRSTIEELRLPGRFDAVLLASHLINDPDRRLRVRWLTTGRRHLADGGSLLLQRLDPSWFDTPRPAYVYQDGLEIVLVEVRRPTSRQVAATIRYRLEGLVWYHRFTVERVDDADLDELLALAGLRRTEFVSADRTWVRADPLDHVGTDVPDGGAAGKSDFAATPTG